MEEVIESKNDIEKVKQTLLEYHSEFRRLTQQYDKLYDEHSKTQQVSDRLLCSKLKLILGGKRGGGSVRVLCVVLKKLGRMEPKNRFDVFCVFTPDVKHKNSTFARLRGAVSQGRLCGVSCKIFPLPWIVCFEICKVCFLPSFVLAILDLLVHFYHLLAGT